MRCSNADSVDRLLFSTPVVLKSEISVGAQHQTSVENEVGGTSKNRLLRELGCAVSSQHGIPDENSVPPSPSIAQPFEGIVGMCYIQSCLVSSLS
jgi:hypothetical protein